MLDKPWLAVDTGRGRFGGSAYLVWDRTHFDTGNVELVAAYSRDGGRTYSRPVQLEATNDDELAGLEHLAQVAVRPDGTVDIVWNGVRDGTPVILHAVSTAGGATFSAPEIVARLSGTASRLGIVTSLTVSPKGRLGLCWSQARSPDRYGARVACTVTDRAGRWGPQRPILPGNRDRQYPPAAAFQGERLWVAAYVSTDTSTRLVVVGRAGNGFGRALTVNRWPVDSDRICAPHPPDCTDAQTFIGDYIGVRADQLTGEHPAFRPQPHPRHRYASPTPGPLGVLTTQGPSGPAVARWHWRDWNAERRQDPDSRRRASASPRLAREGRTRP